MTKTEDLHKAWHILHERFIQHRTITYQDLADQVGLKHARQVARQLLQPIAAHCGLWVYPPIHVSTVSKVTGRPNIEVLWPSFDAWKDGAWDSYKWENITLPEGEQ
jgi:hypothetical protein